MSNSEKSYSFNKVPNWVSVISDEEIISLTVENEKNEVIKASGKGLCHIRREIINTSELSNQTYLLSAWNLNNPEILQGASVSEVFLKEADHLDLHRIQIIRNGELIDKKDDLKVRVLDDESTSSSGSINKNKKVHIVINNLQLGDVLVWEQTIITTFSEKNHVDKKYFRYIHDLPSGYWFYNKYDFKLIQNRADLICVKQRYFRNENGEKLPEKIVKISQGQSYNFEKIDYILNNKPTEFNPYLEIATDASWKDISTHMAFLYEQKLSDESIKNSSIFKQLNLENKDTVEQKITRIIEYVQNNIVYIFDADIMHGHVPQHFDKTLSLKSGDCKAKSLLLVNLLNSIGVKSDFIVVNYGFDYYIPLALPSPFIFDHAIVRISFEDKYYFVDPTWTNRYGLLSYRAEPFFSNYLSIAKNTELEKKEEITTTEIRLEEDIQISLKGGVNTINASSLFRKELADIIRNDFKRTNLVHILESNNKRIAECLGYPIEEGLEKYLSNPTIEVLNDNQDENTIMTVYKATLLLPYGINAKEKVAKYYNSINYPEIYNFNHKDAFCSGFVMYPQKTVLVVESDLFVKKSEAVTARNITIDNEYLFYSNKKDIKIKKVISTSEYLPKRFSPIKTEDIQMMSESYKKINTSNFGTGIVFLGTLEFLFSKWYVTLVLIIVIRMLIIAGSK